MMHSIDARGQSFVNKMFGSCFGLRMWKMRKLTARHDPQLVTIGDQIDPTP
jgi:hypothetical protein